MHFNLFEKVGRLKSWVEDGCYSHQTDITLLVCLLGFSLQKNSTFSATCVTHVHSRY